jgi:hypothetical protein
MMKNHKFVEEIVSKMLLYNHTIYLNDINKIILSNVYNNDINNCLTNIINILNTPNTNQITTKNTLKDFVYRILEFSEGIECCNQLL